jgi:hypothetical protein
MDFEGNTAIVIGRVPVGGELQHENVISYIMPLSSQLPRLYYVVIAVADKREGCGVGRFDGPSHNTNTSIPHA